MVFTLAALLSCTGAFAQRDWAGFGRYNEANKAVLEAQAPSGKATRPKAVFFGDSITDAWANRDCPQFFSEHGFVGRGISGQTTSHMLVRMRRDVIDLHPKYMVLLAGINDIAQNNGAIDVENVFGNIVSIVELCRANKIKPILCTVFPTTHIPWRREVENVPEKIGQLNGLLREYARTHRIPCVDYFTPECFLDGRLKPELSRDGVHPTVEGYAIMQEVILPLLK